MSGCSKNTARSPLIEIRWWIYGESAKFVTLIARLDLQPALLVSRVGAIMRELDSLLCNVKQAELDLLPDVLDLIFHLEFHGQGETLVCIRCIEGCLGQKRLQSREELELTSVAFDLPITICRVVGIVNLLSRLPALLHQIVTVISGKPKDVLIRRTINVLWKLPLMMSIVQRLPNAPVLPFEKHFTGRVRSLRYFRLTGRYSIGAPWSRTDKNWREPDHVAMIE